MNIYKLDKEEECPSQFDTTTSIRGVIFDLISALQSLPSSRHLSLSITKLEEANMWLQESISTSLLRMTDEQHETRNEWAMKYAMKYANRQV